MTLIELHNKVRIVMVTPGAASTLNNKLNPVRSYIFLFERVRRHD